MSRRHRILVVGGGSIGERHVRCFLGTGRAEVSLCELNPERREVIASRYELSGDYADIQSVPCEDLNAVVIATPAHLHIPMALHFLQQGCALFIEKPLAVSLEGLDEFEQAVAAQPVPVAVAYVYRAHPALLAMREALLSGRWGRALQLVVVAGQNFPFYRPAYRETYYTRHETGGGAVQDALTHLVNAAEWLVGPITRVVADCDHLALAGVEVEDTVHVLARHGAVLGSYSLNQHQAPNESTLTVVAERGTLRFEFHQNRWRWMEEPGGDWHDESCGPLERDTLFIRQADHFLNLVEGRVPPACSLAEAIQTLRVNRAILTSTDRQGWVDV